MLLHILIPITSLSQIHKHHIVVIVYQCYISAIHISPHYIGQPTFISTTTLSQICEHCISVIIIDKCYIGEIYAVWSIE